MLYPKLTREALREGAGLPLGGNEKTGGYKGFGLALMVEVDKTIAKIIRPTRKARKGSRARSARAVNNRQSVELGKLTILNKKSRNGDTLDPVELTGTG